MKGKLTETILRKLQPKEKPYKIVDGSGLFIWVTPKGSKLWRLDYRFNGKRKTLALGRYPEISLSEAREIAFEMRKLIARGIDPAVKRKEEKLAKSITFEAIAWEFIEKNKPVWAPTHTDKVILRLRKYLLPSLGSMPINEIKAPHLLNCVRAIEKQGKFETAHRVLQLAGQIIRYAIATGRAEFDPTPALRKALTPSPKRHLPAITDPKELAGILRMIWSYPYSPIVAGALKMLVYTFQRPGEVRNMKWKDIDWERKEWRFIAYKIKKEHIVPLSRQVMEILEELKPLTGHSPYVFMGTSWNRPISNVTTNAALKRMGIDTKNEITSHGFRAVARTLLHEVLGYEPDIIEHQLAHKVPDRLGEAYNRTKFLDHRRKMMQDWADYIDALREGKEKEFFKKI